MAQVLIVGAGPGGAGLAHRLAHRGVDVTLIERQSDFAREFRGEVLVPGGLAALADIGVADALAGVPSAHPRSIEIYFNRRRIIDFDFDPDLFEGRPPLVISQPALLESDRVERAAAFHPARLAPWRLPAIGAKLAVRGGIDDGVGSDDPGDPGEGRVAALAGALPPGAVVLPVYRHDLESR